MIDGATTMQGDLLKIFSAPVPGTGLLDTDRLIEEGDLDPMVRWHALV